MADLHPGDEFAGHRIEGLAGRGGMGVVYRATELTLERVVALKLIAPALAGAPDFRARFLRESRAAASIEHPNVLPIYYAGGHGDELYIAMRYVEGQDLRTLVRASGGLPSTRAAAIVAQVGAGLDAAHERGLVHRDVKPANVLVGARDHAYLTDFGLAKHVESTGALSRAGGWVGTAGYVAPEQIRGDSVDARTDVYALGCVLAYALTGKPPYVRDSEQAMLWAHMQAEPPGRDEGIPPALEPVVARALAKDPADRYLSAGDLGRAALAAAGATPPPGPERTVARGDAAPPPRGAVTVMSDRPAPTPTPSTPAPTPTPATPVAAAPPPAAPPPARPPARAGGGPRRLLPALGAVAVVAAMVVAGILLLGGGDDQPTSGTQRTTAGESPSAGGFAVSEGTSTAPVVQRPTSLAVAQGNVWATSDGARRAARIDATSMQRKPASGRIPAGTTDVAVDGDTLWVVSQETNTLTHLDARTGRVLGDPQQLPAGNPFSVAVDSDDVWVGSRASPDRTPVNQVLRISKSDRVVQSFPVPAGVVDIAVGDTAVWITNAEGSTVTRLDKAAGTQRTIEVGSAPKGIAVGGGLIWVANSGDGSVSIIRDVGDGESVGQVSVGADPQLIVYGDNDAWVSLRDTSEVVRVDRSPVVTARVETATDPFALAFGEGKLFVASLSEDVVQSVRPS